MGFPALASSIIAGGTAFPLWLKILYTLFVAVVVAVYIPHYGWGNFLWFSDVALILAVPALWMENSLLASMMLLGIALPELGWNIGFWGRLLTGHKVFGLADYMFQSQRPLSIRALSLFHVFLPLLLLLIVSQRGYDPRALPAMTVLAWIILPLSRLLTAPERNVNWVYGPGTRPQKKLPDWLYLLIVMLVFPVGFYLPTHALLQSLFRR